MKSDKSHQMDTDVGSGVDWDMEGWVIIQEQTFKNWINDKLRSRDIKVEYLQVDLCDGIVLCSLVEILQSRSLDRVIRGERLNQHEASANVCIALQALIDDGIKLVNIGAQDVCEGNLKLILGLIWTIIRHYQISADTGLPPRRLILSWINAVLHPHRRVNNFTSDWSDGAALQGLVEYCHPGTFPQWMNISSSDRLTACERAMSAAHSLWSIPLIISPSALYNSRLDEQSMMTYLSYFMTEGAPGYVATLKWVQDTLETETVTNFNVDWNDGYLMSCLVYALGGFLPGFTSIDRNNHLNNIQTAMQASKESFDINHIITANDMLNAKVGHIGIMAYLTWHRAKAQGKLRRSISQAFDCFVSVQIGDTSALVILDELRSPLLTAATEHTADDQTRPQYLSSSVSGSLTSTDSQSSSEDQAQHSQVIIPVVYPSLTQAQHTQHTGVMVENGRSVGPVEDFERYEYPPMDVSEIDGIERRAETHIEAHSETHIETHIEPQIKTRIGTHDEAVTTLYVFNQPSVKEEKEEPLDELVDEVLEGPLIEVVNKMALGNYKNITIDVGGYDPDSLNLIQESPDGLISEIHSFMSHHGKSIYRFQPHIQGEWRVYLTCGGERVRGSERLIHVVDVSLVRVIQTSKQLNLHQLASFTVDTTSCPGDIDIEYRVMLGDMEISVRDSLDSCGRLRHLEFSTEIAGVYDVTVIYDGIHATGSPFHVWITLEEENAESALYARVLKTKPVPTGIQVIEPDQTGLNQNQQDLGIIHLSDSFDGTHEEITRNSELIEGTSLLFALLNRQTTFKINPRASNADLRCSIRTVDGQYVACDKRTDADGNHSFTYRPTQEGEHVIELTSSSGLVEGSPFHVNVRRGRVYVSGLVPVMLVDKKYTFFIDAYEIDKGKLSINTSLRILRVDKTHRHVYAVTVQPHVTGKHDVIITLNGQSIPGCPYIVEVRTKRGLRKLSKKRNTSQVLVV